MNRLLLKAWSTEARQAVITTAVVFGLYGFLVITGLPRLLAEGAPSIVALLMLFTLPRPAAVRAQLAILEQAQQQTGAPA